MNRTQITNILVTKQKQQCYREIVTDINNLISKLQKVGGYELIITNLCQLYNKYATLVDETQEIIDAYDDEDTEE